jgi:hypothetical protein
MRRMLWLQCWERNMPGLFPNHTLIEDGCERIKTPGNKVMIVSGDGTMQQGSGGSAASLELNVLFQANNTPLTYPTVFH